MLRSLPTLDHASVPVVDNGLDEAVLAMLPETGAPGAPAFIDAATRAGGLLSPTVSGALDELVEEGQPAGALLLRGMPIGAVPPTPASPLDVEAGDGISEFVLLTVARRLGEPVGYAPEHGGDIVQNLLPTRADTTRQTSTSSGVDLEFHTETAFHPHQPRFLLLLCRRGDPRAQTRLAAITQLVGRLPTRVRDVLRQPRFRIGVDESFRRAARRGTPPPLGDPMPVLSGPPGAPRFTFDADLMVGTDEEASAAIDTVRETLREAHVAVTLEAGDLLVIDNTVAVHGRSSFPARFDGTDRWLQRAFVVADLAASAADRDGRVITTAFA